MSNIQTTVEHYSSLVTTIQTTIQHCCTLLEASIIESLREAEKTLKFRQAAQTPVVEYALEIALSSLGGSTPVGMYGRGHDFGQRLGPLAEGNWYFPRYSVASPNEFQQLASEIERDFWNLCGHEWNNTIAVDFSDVLPTSGT